MTRWYVSTAGVGRDDDYRWLALAGGAATEPQTVMYERLGGSERGGSERGGSELGDLTSESEHKPSVLLWRRSDGSFAVYADGLLPPGAPAKGDYHGRTIRAALMGISADPAPLLAAAAAALAGRLAPAVPVRWEASSPVVADGADKWKPPEPRPDGDPTGLPAELAGSWGLPWERGPSVARELAGLDAAALRSYPKDRILLFSTKLIGVDQLEQFRPWRALTPSLSRPRDFKEGKREPDATGRRRPAVRVAVGVVAAVVVVAVWAVTRPSRPAPGRPLPPAISTTPSTPPPTKPSPAKPSPTRPSPTKPSPTTPSPTKPSPTKPKTPGKPPKPTGTRKSG